MKRTEYKNHTSENALRTFTMKRTIMGAVGSAGGGKSTHYTKVSISFN